MATDRSVLDRLQIENTDRRQIEAVVAALNDVLRDRLVGAYLYGSAVLGGLRPRSDLDVLAVSTKKTTREEKKQLARHLLRLSGGDSRAVEVTMVVSSEIRPWVYPPPRDFQYGEWWRARFEEGDVEPWPSATDPDVALLIAMARLGGAALVGPPPSQAFDPIPKRDFVEALVADIDGLIKTIDSDTRNVVLTLARTWNTLVTGEIHSKEEAAEWTLQRLASEHRPVLERARDVYLGGANEQWADLEDRIGPFADALVAEIEGARRHASFDDRAV